MSSVWKACADITCSYQDNFLRFLALYKDIKDKVFDLLIVPTSSAKLQDVPRFVSLATFFHCVMHRQTFSFVSLFRA